jgi:hypothetical protein
VILIETSQLARRTILGIVGGVTIELSSHRQLKLSVPTVEMVLRSKNGQIVPSCVFVSQGFLHRACILGISGYLLRSAFSFPRLGLHSMSKQGSERQVSRGSREHVGLTPR